MSVLIKHMAMPKGCIYANDKDQTEYCPLLNHDEVPFCQYIENEPEIAIGIDERPVYCPLSDVPEPCQDTVSRQAAIDALKDAINDSVVLTIQGDMYSHNDNYFGLEVALSIIRKLPSAQPEQQWIPCSIRPPESGLVLVTYTDGDVDIMVQPTAYREYDIVAWMPIEPYKEENNERA